MAQDFYAAFDVGADERRISTIDSDGVALAAIQGLYDMVKENEGMIAHLESRPVAQQDRIDKLEARLAVLEARLTSHTPAPFHAGLGVLVGVPAFAIFGLLAMITHRRTQKAGVR